MAARRSGSGAPRNRERTGMIVLAPPAVRAPLAVSDLARIVDLEEPAISPDGKRVAVIVLRSDRSSLWLIDVATKKARLLASGGSVSVPRWSPDGAALAFLQDAGGALQIRVWSGGATRRAGNFPGGVVDFAWSPNGSEFAVGATDTARPEPYFVAGDNDYTVSATPPSEHLWLLARSGAARRLTRGSWSVAPTDAGGIFTSQFAWSRDGTRLIFTRLRNTFSGDNEYSSLWQVDVRTGALTKLTAHDAFDFSPIPSPVGKRWIYSYPRGGNYLANNTILPLSNAGSREITSGFGLNAGGVLWMPDGKSLVVCANDKTRVDTWKFDLNGRFAPVPLGGLNMSCDSYQDGEFDSGIAASVSKTGALAFVASDSTHPRELYYLSSLFAVPRPLTHFNGALRHAELGVQRQISWRSADGFTEYGVVTFPPGMQAGRKYPIVVNVHGGPGETSIRDFAPAPLWPRPQLIAAHGYIVFEPNYRGSDDAGNAFLLAIAGDPVRGPAADILGGLDAVTRLPQADPKRVGVCGWSYGGLMTSWLITQDHRWRAAVSGAAVDDEIEEYAFSESNVQDRFYQKTSPFAPGGDAAYRHNTPITFAAAVTTPTLIWSTTRDPVVPITQSYEFYHALKEHHVPVRFVVFPASTHGPSDEIQRETLTRLWLAWLDKYMRR